jgi:uncharacterized membrane protein (UPF0182 family)
MVKNNKKISILVVLLLGLWLFFNLASHLAVEILWFHEVGYLREFWLRLVTRLGLWAIAFFTSAGFLLGNLTVASRLKHLTPSPPVQAQRITPGGVRSDMIYERQAASKSGLRLRLLLPVVLGLSVLVGLILIYLHSGSFRFLASGYEIAKHFLAITTLVKAGVAAIALAADCYPNGAVGFAAGVECCNFN